MQGTFKKYNLKLVKLDESGKELINITNKNSNELKHIFKNAIYKYQLYQEKFNLLHIVQSFVSECKKNEIDGNISITKQLIDYELTIELNIIKNIYCDQMRNNLYGM